MPTLTATIHSPTFRLAIGQPWPGRAGIYAGIYAGITTGPDGAPYALLLLDDKPAKGLIWDDAMAWASGLGADLPNRVESALLFANLKSNFESRWHWTNEQYSRDYAWTQLFDGGSQSTTDKSFEGRARAVRRLILQPFSHS